MRRLTLVLVTLLLSPVASAAPWLQFGHDAARSGATADPGPASGDTAFMLGLEGPPSASPLVVLDDEILVPRFVGGKGIVYAIGLDTAQVTPRVVVPERVDQIASDGRSLFVTTARNVASFSVATGEPLWEAPLPKMIPGEAEGWNWCIEPAVVDDVVYVACDQFSEPAATDRYSWPFVLGLNTTTGRTVMDWRAFDEAPTPCSGPACSNPVVRGGHGTAHIPWIAVAGDTLVVVGTDVSTRVGRLMGAVTSERTTLSANPIVWGIDRFRGEAIWTLDDGVRPYGRADANRPEGEATRQVIECGSQLSASPEFAFIRIGTTLYILRAKDGAVEWTANIDERKSGTDLSCGGSAMAYAGGALYVTSFSTLYRFNVASRAEEWRRTFESEGENFYGGYGMAVSGGRVYVIANNGLVSAIDADTKEDVWRFPLRNGGETNPHYLAVGEGVVVAAGWQGDVTVLGNTGASILLSVQIASVHPPPGEPFRVDLSATQPGAMGPAEEFRADWGDGAVTEWQASPAIEHVYREHSEVKATFYVRNAAGQVSSQAVVLDVGGTPPRDLNFMQEAFASENLDMTWGVIGVGLVFIGGIAAGWRRRRHQSVLADEMRELRDIRAQAVDDPLAAAGRLEGYDTRIVADLDARRLTDAQYSVLRLEVQTVRRTIGKRAIAPVATRLPPPLRAALQSALDDGQITPAEAAALRDSVGSDRRLSRTVRKDVLALIDAWRGLPG